MKCRSFGLRKSPTPQLSEKLGLGNAWNKTPQADEQFENFSDSSRWRSHGENDAGQALPAGVEHLSATCADIQFGTCGGSYFL